MQTSKQAPPQRKNDSDQEITMPKISRTLWKPSSLEKSERKTIVKGRFYEIEHNQIGAFSIGAENPRELIKEIFRPMKVRNIKVLKELSFCQKNGRGRYLMWSRKPVAYTKTIGASIASQFKHLQKLHLNFGQGFDGKDLQELGIQIGRNLTNLRCLTVDFDTFHRLHVKDLHIFIREISKNLTNLKQLLLYFETPEGMTRESLRELTHDICRYSRELEHFSFRCPSDGPKDEDIEKFLIDMGSSLPKLETLKLNFELVTEFGHKSIEGLNYLMGQHSNRLKSLSLSFGSNHSYAFSKSSWLNEEDYEKMFKGITRLKDLQKLKLKLKGILTDKVLSNIAKQVFQSLSKLTHFTLETDEKITDTGLKDITSAFKLKQNPLQQFKLQITSSPYISNEGFDVLMSGIATHLPELQELELNFPDCKKIGSSALRSLALKVIKPSATLNNLKFNFSRCRSIKGKGLEEFLIEIVNRQKSLKSVNLVLEHIGDFGFSEHYINRLLASCPLIKWKINNY